LEAFVVLSLYQHSGLVWCWCLLLGYRWGFVEEDMEPMVGQHQDLKPAHSLEAGTEDIGYVQVVTSLAI
jgi:hypothetical protein